MCIFSFQEQGRLYPFNYWPFACGLGPRRFCPAVKKAPSIEFGSINLSSRIKNVGFRISKSDSMLSFEYCSQIDGIKSFDFTEIHSTYYNS